MRTEKQSSVEGTEASIESRPTVGRYEPPRVVRSRRLTEVTGQVAPVPSGAPAPTPTPG